jgi:hypothetical protein
MQKQRKELGNVKVNGKYKYKTMQNGEIKGKRMLRVYIDS